MTQSELTDLATRYAAAWSGQNPEELASFYAEEWTLSADGLIQESRGNYDEAEYRRQMSTESGGS